MMDTQSSRYLIPRRITQRWEILPGWGWRELGAAGVGLGIGAVLLLLSLLLPTGGGWGIAGRSLLVLLPTGCGVGLAMPMVAGGSMLDMLLDARAYGRTRHLYPSDFGRDDT